MKKEIAEKWVSALRSGKYKQGKCDLKRKDKYCCLGVLCDISKLGKFDKEDRYLDTIGTLPTEVKEYAGMKTSCGICVSLGHSLITQNDSGSSFEEIADIIEKHWEEL